MANVDSPRGLWPVRHLCGGEIRTTEYTVTTGATIYRGDVVSLADDGTVGAAAAGDATAVVGVAAEYVEDSGSVGGKKIRIYDDPNIVFGIQQESEGEISAADVGATADHVAGSGNSVTLISGHELSSTVGTGNAQFMVIGLVNEPNNSWGEHADVEVIFNEHRYAGTRGAGV